MKILLVQPWHNRRPQYYLSLATIAASILELDPKIEIKVLDLNITPYDEAQRVLSDPSFSIIGITGLIAYFAGIEQVADFINRNNPDPLLVLGGLGVTSYPDFITKHIKADIYVLGEGEITIKEIIQSFNNQSGYKRIRGIVYREGEDVVFNEPRKAIKNLDELPFSNRDLFAPLEGNNKVITMIGSRGCPGRCAFCFRDPADYYRSRSIENIMEEIEHLVVKRKAEFIKFSDEYFLVSKNKIFQFCKAVRKSGLSFLWNCSLRVEIADNDIIREMKESGCAQVSFGIESGSSKILEAMNKKVTVGQNENALKVLRENKMYCGVNMIIGYPGETKETIRETEEMLHRAKAPGSFHLIQAYPGTPLYDYALKNGYIKDELDYFRTTYRADKNLLINYTKLSTEYLESEALRISQETQRKYAHLFRPSLLDRLRRKIK